MKTKDQIYIEGYNRGEKVANKIVKTIPHIGEMFPESLHVICKEFQIPVDVPVDEKTKIERIYVCSCGDYQLETANRETYVKFDEMEGRVNFDVWATFSSGLAKAYNDIWLEKYVPEESPDFRNKL